MNKEESAGDIKQTTVAIVFVAHMCIGRFLFSALVVSLLANPSQRL